MLQIKVLLARIRAYFSSDSYFRKEKATIVFSLPRDNPFPDCSFRLKIGKMIYYFEGIPNRKEYTTLSGDERIEYEYKYGGWEVDFIQ